MAKSSRRAALANPSTLKPADADDRNAIQVVVETPKGSRNKYAFDQDQRVFRLTKVLPAEDRPKENSRKKAQKAQKWG